VTLGDDIVAVLPELRAANASLLVDVGRIVRPGPGTYDPNTGLVTPVDAPVHGPGPCRMRQPAGIVEAERLFGDTQITASRFLACWPHDLTGVKIDDVVILDQTADVDLLGRRFRILAIPMQTWSLYKAFPCELVE